VLTVFTATVPNERIQRYAKLFDEAGAGMAVEFTPLGAIPTIRDGMEQYEPRAAPAVPG
jgi:hypothetical protein